MRSPARLYPRNSKTSAVAGGVCREAGCDAVGVARTAGVLDVGAAVSQAERLYDIARDRSSSASVASAWPCGVLSQCDRCDGISSLRKAR